MFLDAAMCTTRPVYGYEGRYEVDDSGAVFSLLAGRRLLRPTLMNDGYCRLSLYGADGRRRILSVHRIVASSFFGDFPELQVNHINGIKTDNSLKNLEWVTRSQNMQHAVRTGLHSMLPKLSKAGISQAAELRAQGLGYAAIGDALGVSVATAHKYVRMAVINA